VKQHSNLHAGPSIVFWLVLQLKVLHEISCRYLPGGYAVPEMTCTVSSRTLNVTHSPQYRINCLVLVTETQPHMCVNNLPMVVNWQCTGAESNQRPAVSQLLVRRATKPHTVPQSIVNGFSNMLHPHGLRKSLPSQTIHFASDCISVRIIRCFLRLDTEACSIH